MKKIRIKNGFTIMEVLLAASIFTIIATISTTVFVRTVQANTRTEILNGMYEDGRVIMDQLTNEIQHGAIDYEEYYSINVLQKNIFNNNPDKYNEKAAYGLYYGAYASRFYDPGWTLPNGNSGSNPYDLGVDCSFPDPFPVPSDPTAPCEIYYSDSKDIDTGQNPYDANVPDSIFQSDANAICEGASCSTSTGSTYTDGSKIISDELYLISEDENGTNKTIFSQLLLRNNNPSDGTRLSTSCSDQAMNDILDCGIGKLKLNGSDSDNNGVVDTFKCEGNYNCGLPTDLSIDYHLTGSGAIAVKNDHLKEFNFGASESFVPITPFRTSIQSVQFIISPPEDPYKGFDEVDMQVQPYVTIILQIQPSVAERNRYRGYEIGKLILQRTVTAGVAKNINSYPPTNNVEWICTVMNKGLCTDPNPL